MPRLRRSNTSAPGLRRLKSGRGFRYVDVSGSAVDSDTRAYIESLVIPPAWTDVWIAPYPHGHIRATGVDAAGRTQYLYHPQWRVMKDRAKFDRALELAASLPAARRQVTMDLRDPEANRGRALAAAFRMLDTGSLRVGSEQYAKLHGSHGLSTLLCSHATVSGETVSLAFPGKSGKAWASELTDPDLARFITVLKRRGGDARLLAWKSAQQWHPLLPEEINEYVRERTGGQFTAKDFRTLHGTVIAAVALAQAGPQRSATARSKVVAQVMRDVAASLGNTPAVARASYVDPRVIDHFERGVTIDPTRASAAESELRALLG